MKNIILIGMKACGKSTVGRLLTKRLDVDFIELDSEIEKKHFQKKNGKLVFREIFRHYGADYFRKLESKILNNISKEKKLKKFVLSCGGGTPLNEKNQKILKEIGVVIFLDAKDSVLLTRMIKDGIPSFFPYPDDPKKSLNELLKKRRPIYEKIADKIISFDKESPKELVEKIISSIK